MKKLFLLPAVLFALSACNKERNNSISSTQVTGVWKFIGYSDGIAGIPFTSAGSTELYLQFDTANAHFMEYRNGEKVCGIYSFEADTSNNYYKGILTLNGSLEPDKYNVSASHDTLILYPTGYVDAFTNYYVASPNHFEWCSNLPQ